MKRARCEAEEVVYIGDNPRKDFCGIRPLGFRTIRVVQGNHAEVVVPAEQDAEVSVDDLGAALAVVRRWEERA